MQKHAKTLGANELLELIFVYLTEVSSLHDYNEILEVLANMGRALTNADRCSVWVVSEDRKTIKTKVAHGIDEIELPIDSGLVGDAVVNGSKIIIDDVYLDDRFNPEVDKQTGYRTKSMMVMPMFDYYDNIIGAFQVINHRGEKEAFDKRDIERLSLASTYAAETIISAQLSKEIEDTQREVVFTMGSIGESRSKETGNHVKRVAEYSKLLALAYGLPETEAELLKQASPMHDIGKVAIPDAILNKPGRFDENERYIMEKHAELGYHMIKNSERPLLKAAAIVAYQHHEKWDGSGYPNKISGEDIHIYGRITALADVFDALGSDRVYKKAWSDERIFSLIKEERGRHFDPKLVDIFFDRLDEILLVRDTYKDKYLADTYHKKGDSKQIQILGAFGTKSKGHGTSAFLLNKNSVIDAGNLLDALDVATTNIENIWVTHAHLDHISDIAYILDNYFHLRRKSLNIIGLPETIKVIKESYLNGTLWPDFSKIKLVHSDAMAVTYTQLSIGKEYQIGESESIRAFETDHTIESCGYIYYRDSSGVMITADTYSLQNAISIINADDKITSLVVECSFPNEMEKLAIESKHLTPKLLFNQLTGIKRKDLNIYINHMKPSFLQKISDEIRQISGDWETKVLNDGEFINF